MRIAIGNGYAFRSPELDTNLIYIIDNVLPSGMVDIQVCKAKDGSNWETQGESPVRWICIKIDVLYRMIDQGFYSPIAGKFYTEEVQRFRP